MGETRVESDTMGAVRVPADRYWGAQTQRSLENFTIGRRLGHLMPPAVIHAFGLVKKASARVNHDLGKLDATRAALIERAADEVARGLLDDHFPLVVWQTGSGTQSNMNANEVIANRAAELAGAPLGGKSPVHPNDHVNLSQSSNDVFPTVMHVAVVELLGARLLPSVATLRGALEEKAAAFADVVKIGRTHLMDATPLTLGQEIGGWAAQLRGAERRLVAAREALLDLAIGGTAVGTGLGSHPEWAARAAAEIAALAGAPFRPAPDRFAALAGHDALVDASSAHRQLATVLTKIGNDVRLLASGPRAGLGELRIPSNEPGSSIMPGKVNPTQAEALTMVAAHVLGLDVAVGVAGASGTLELNVMKPMIVHAVLEQIELLSDACDSFTENCVRGLEPDRAGIARHVERSLMLVTALSPVIGYDAAAAIAKDAHARGVSLREAAIASGKVTAVDFDRVVRPERMLGPA